MSLCDRLAIGEFAEFLDGLNMAAAHEIAPHDVTPTVDEGVRAFARSLSVIDIDDGDYAISFRTDDLITIRASHSGWLHIPRSFDQMRQLSL
jgi:hypothetical protein